MEAKELMELKGKIERGKERLAGLKGEKKTLMASLKKDYDCDSVEQGLKVIAKTDKDIDKLDKEIREALEKLEIDFPDLFIK